MYFTILYNFTLSYDLVVPAIKLEFMWSEVPLWMPEIAPGARCCWNWGANCLRWCHRSFDVDAFGSFRTSTDFSVFIDQHELCWIGLQTERGTLVNLGHLKSHISWCLLKNVKRDLGWNPDASRFEVTIVCFFLGMNFEDGRFQECLFQDFSGDCGTGARRCRSCAIDEARDPTGHSMWTPSDLSGVARCWGNLGRRSGFKTSTDFWVSDQHEHCWIGLQTERWTLVSLGHLKSHISWCL